MSSGFSEAFKNGKLDGLFVGISLGLKYGTVLGSPVVTYVGASVVASIGFNDGNLDVTLDEKPLVVEGRFYPVVEL